MRILIAPLDWGLGHATRCIPIISYLLAQHVEVVLGSEGRCADLLRKEFPQLEFIRIPGYGVSYPKGSGMAFKIAYQIPKIVRAIKREHTLLKELIRDKNISAVISDNRYGLWSKEIPCVFITHQLIVKSPLLEKFVRRLNYKYIVRFSECWIPDYAGENNLSGDLSHKFLLPNNAQFIGPLSRFVEEKIPSNKVVSGEGVKNILVLLSGPEPQRSLLESKMLDSIGKLKEDNMHLKFTVVQGMTEFDNTRKISDRLEIISHLTTRDLQSKINSSDLVLCRSGYSTIMDLAALSKKAIFIPTPGQTEQEYLAIYLRDKKIAYSVSQNNFILEEAILKSKNYSGFNSEFNGTGFQKTMDSFLAKILKE